jgi:hypothetical protein
MNLRQKPILTAAAAFGLLYTVTPFFAGVFHTSDPRGPKIFFEAHHDILYTIGNGGQAKIPLRERPWFYGMKASSTQHADEREVQR